jgi:hypothetical protein
MRLCNTALVEAENHPWPSEWVCNAQFMRWVYGIIASPPNEIDAASMMGD